MDLIGSKIGSYRITRLLGEGGMGAVYEARHEVLMRRVAIKLLHPHLIRQPQLVERFFNEALAVNVVEHPGLINVSDCGQVPGGPAYLVMEYLEGETLARRLERGGGRLPVAVALHLCWQVASVLAAVHARKIIHRDLKPENIMIVPDLKAPGGERVKLLDFGIAKLMAEFGGGGAVITQTGMVLGTPLYMAPEQWGSRDVSPKMDVYSMGVMLYQMLAGRPPFIADDVPALMFLHASHEVPDLAALAPALPQQLVSQVHAMLAKAAAARPDMAEVEAWLLQWEAPPQEVVRGPDVLARTSAQMRGQTQPAAVTLGPRRWLPVAAAFLAGSLLAVAGLRGLLVEQRLQQQPKPTSLVAVDLGPPEPPPARPIVRRLVVTRPAGAQVILRGERGAETVLGHTPWREEGASAPGRLLLRVRLPGYVPRDLELDLGTNESWSETLEPLPPAPIPQGSGSSGGGRKKKSVGFSDDKIPIPKFPLPYRGPAEDVPR